MKTWAWRCIWAGIILSGLMLGLSMMSADVTSVGMIEAILFLFIASPFVILGIVLRLARVVRPVLLLAIPYLACHVILDGSLVVNHPRPQEFGYLGLFVVPFYESIVAIPVGALLILVTEARAKRQTPPLQR